MSSRKHFCILNHVSFIIVTGLGGRAGGRTDGWEDGWYWTCVYGHVMEDGREEDIGQVILACMYGHVMIKIASLHKTARTDVTHVFIPMLLVTLKYAKNKHGGLSKTLLHKFQMVVLFYRGSTGQL